MMDENKRTPRAVIWSAVLHLGLAGFLLATTLSCTTWAHLVDALGLPKSLSPLQCTVPHAARGPVIEATLVGMPAAPTPAPAPTKHVSPAPPPPAPQPPPPAPAPAPPVKTLPPPPKHPATHSQQKVVAESTHKAEQAKHLQEQKQAQRMSELNQIFQQMNQVKQARQQAEQQSKLQQKKLASAQQSEPSKPAPSKAAPRARSGSNGVSAADAYLNAIQNAVTHAWVHPDTIPKGSKCPVHIVQIPGGKVISVTVASSCQFGAAGRRSIKNAVLRASPLPYQGFEKSFRSNVTLNFKVTN